MRESELRDYAARLRPDEECEGVTLDIMEFGISYRDAMLEIRNIIFSVLIQFIFKHRQTFVNILNDFIRNHRKP